MRIFFFFFLIPIFFEYYCFFPPIVFFLATVYVLSTPPPFSLPPPLFCPMVEPSPVFHYSCRAFFPLIFRPATNVVLDVVISPFVPTLATHLLFPLFFHFCSPHHKGLTGNPSVYSPPCAFLLLPCYWLSSILRFSGFFVRISSETPFFDQSTRPFSLPWPSYRILAPSVYNWFAGHPTSGVHVCGFLSLLLDSFLAWTTSSTGFGA